MRLSFQQETLYSPQLANDLHKISPQFSSDNWRHLISLGQIYSCSFNQRYVAYCLLSIEEGKLIISQFQVRDITQRRGIGLFMFQQLCALAKQHHCNSLHFPQATEASGIAFYQRLNIKADLSFQL